MSFLFRVYLIWRDVVPLKNNVEKERNTARLD